MYISRSFIHRAEYPSHRIFSLCVTYDRKHFSNTQGILLAPYTCIYLVLLSISRIERATHKYTDSSSLIHSRGSIKPYITVMTSWSNILSPCHDEIHESLKFPAGHEF